MQFEWPKKDCPEELTAKLKSESPVIQEQEAGTRPNHEKQRAKIREQRKENEREQEKKCVTSRICSVRSSQSPETHKSKPPPGAVSSEQAPP